jgi:hypothetical protein
MVMTCVWNGGTQNVCEILLEKRVINRPQGKPKRGCRDDFKTLEK